MDGWNGRGRTGTKNKSSQESSATSWRETDRKEKGADKLPDEGDEEDDDEDEDKAAKEEQEKRGECLRNIKKHHNAFMIAQTEAKLRIGKFEGNMYQARSTHAQGPVGQGRQDPNGAV